MAEIKIIVERQNQNSTSQPEAKSQSKGIIRRKRDDELLGRRRKADSGDGGGGGGGGGTVRAAPVLTVNHYKDTIRSQGYGSGGYVEQHRYTGAYVDTSRPYAQLLQFEVSLNSDFSSPFQQETNRLYSGSNQNEFLCLRKFTCEGQTDETGEPLINHGLRGTTQYVRARDYDGYSWSLWGSVQLIYEDDFSVPPGYQNEFSDRCN